jgi:hypothetical protein
VATRLRQLVPIVVEEAVVAVVVVVVVTVTQAVMVAVRVTTTAVDETLGGEGAAAVVAVGVAGLVAVSMPADCTSPVLFKIRGANFCLTSRGS